MVRVPGWEQVPRTRRGIDTGAAVLRVIRSVDQGVDA